MLSDEYARDVKTLYENDKSILETESLIHECPIYATRPSIPPSSTPLARPAPAPMLCC